MTKFTAVKWVVGLIVGTLAGFIAPAAIVAAAAIVTVEVFDDNKEKIEGWLK